MSKISIDSYRETVEAVCNALIPASDSLITVIEENADLFGEIAAKLYPVYKRLEAELEKVSEKMQERNGSLEEAMIK